ncbi:MAG: polyamine ABC transporter ATP-binding protein [Tagaea sp. CACIAM 22H2]|nr:polyamine ABC transporter ATP-binding protein [Tagaea sp. CACIAM 22H2]
MIRLSGVAKSFGGAAAVDGVDLEIGEGEIFCLLGPSGCGKTTLLRLIGGFEAPDAGTVELDGKDVTQVPPWARPVNTVFQSYALFPHLDVARNVRFGLETLDMTDAERDARVAEMLALVKLGDFAKRRPSQLSGGQRQRVAIARALARHPRVLLLDEPLSALDRKLREETRLELVELQARLGIAFVFVTHDQDEAMAISDRVGVMEKGKIIQIATPTDLYERPASKFVAEFVGRVNLIPRDEGGWFVLRPEKLSLFQGPHKGRVRECQYLGERRLVFLDTQFGTLTASAAGDAPIPANGAEIAFGWAENAGSVITR